MKIETLIIKGQEDVKFIAENGTHLVFRRFEHGYLGSGVMGDIVNYKRVKVSASEVKITDKAHNLPQITNWGEVIFATRQKQKPCKNQ